MISWLAPNAAGDDGAAETGAGVGDSGRPYLLTESDLEPLTAKVNVRGSFLHSMVMMKRVWSTSTNRHGVKQVVSPRREKRLGDTSVESVNPTISPVPYTPPSFVAVDGNTSFVVLILELGEVRATRRVIYRGQRNVMNYAPDGFCSLILSADGWYQMRSIVSVACVRVWYMGGMDTRASAAIATRA